MPRRPRAWWHAAAQARALPRLLLLFLAAAVAAAAAAAAPPPVLLRSREVNPRGPSRRALLAAAAPLAGLPPPPGAGRDDARWGPLAGGELFIVALHDGADPDAARAAIASAGGMPSVHLPEAALLAILPARGDGGQAAADALAASAPATIAWVAPFAAPYKTAPEWDAVLAWIAETSDAGDGGGDVADGGEPGAARPSAAAALGPPPRAAAPYLRPPPPRTAAAAAASSSSTPPPTWTVDILVTFPPLGPWAQAGPPPPPPSGAPYAPAAAAAAAWAPAIQAICAGACALASSDSPSASRLSITAPAAAAPALLPWLAASPVTHWLSPRARARPRNFYAGGICQAGAPGRVDVATGVTWEPAGGGGAVTATPHWAAGLTGAGQTLGMGDTGLDADHCLFRDGGVPGPGAPGAAPARPGSDGVRAWESTTHRKLRYYRMLADGLDANGHGTHCAGSAVGAVLDGGPPTARPWSGSAPAARLAFTDLGSGPAGDLAVPLDLSADYFSHHYSRGARVHSDSWGTDATAYDDMAWDFDAFAAAHPDFLPVIAAGNDGADGGDGAVTSPAVAKNALAVGATLTAPFSGSPEFEAVGERRDGEAVRLTVSGAGPRPGGGPHRALAAGFGPALPLSDGLARRLVAAAPPDACAPLTGPASVWAGAIVLATRGNCSFAAKAAAAGAAGAAALLVANNGPGGLVRAAPPPAGAPAGPLAPTAALSAASGRDVGAALAAGVSLTGVLSREALPTNRFESLAYFSSTGPTPDGRTKPDLVAPGTTVSAYSDGEPGSANCGLGVDRGTSMATPVAAGAAALARQYFSEGWHVSGAPNASAGLPRPSAALLRAVLLGGAAPMRGVRPSNSGAVDGAPLEPGTPHPSAAVGHGRLHLGRALPLAPVNASVWGLAIADAVSLRSQGEAARFCVRAAPGRRPLSVTLAWTDPPPSPAAATPLVNDLDLTVTSEALAGFPRRGNVGAGPPDRANTVERVWLDDGGGAAGGEVVITVSAARLPAGPQAFALAVHGGLASPLRSGPACAALPIPSITSAPRPLTNATTARFSWSASSPPPAGWECRLAGPGGATGPPPLRAWSPCPPPPLTASGLADGPHEFGVRAAGYSLADVRAFTVDATAPVANLTSVSAPVPGSPRSAAFTFGPAASPRPEPGGVSFFCRLARTSPPPGRPAEPLPVVSGLGNGTSPAELGAWAPCASPLRLASLGPGAWALSVRAADAAGNAQAVPPATAAWTVALPGRVAALASAVAGSAGRSTNASTGTAAFTFFAAGDGGGGGGGGGESGPAQDASDAPAFLCQLSVLEAASGSFTPTGPPAPCTSPATYGGLARGTYRFAVGLADNTTAAGGGTVEPLSSWPAGALALAATADVSVASDTPTPGLTASPAPLIGATDAAKPLTLDWALDGGAPLPTGGAYACLLQGPPAAASTVGQAWVGDFAPCAPPLTLPPLPDGSYAFRVAVQSPDGSRGPPASAAFVVDAAPPGVDAVAWADAASGRAVGPSPGTLCSIRASAPASLRATPTASDGVLGSGVAAVYCRLVLDGGAAGVAGVGGGGGGRGAATESARARRTLAAAASSTDGWEPCAAGLDVSLTTPGDHTLQVRAVDAAGNGGAGVECGLRVTGDGSGVPGGRGGLAAAVAAAVLAGLGLLAGLGVTSAL